jgi:hypothetical protein
MKKGAGKKPALNKQKEQRKPSVLDGLHCSFVFSLKM